MVTLLQALLLGLVQGITEWLPISSSAHLVILQEILRIKASVFFDVMLHFATLIVIFLIFYKDVLKINLKYLLLILIASIPIAIVGFFFKAQIESFFSNLLIVSIALLFTGFLLLISKLRQGNKNITKLDSLIIGLSQAIAIIPGISRSGSTISTALLRNIKKEEAIKFSFLLAIPAILGATILKTLEANPSDFNLNLLIGMLITILVGYFSLKFLIRIILKNKFHYFSYYCFALGLIILIYTTLK